MIEIGHNSTNEHRETIYWSKFTEISGKVVILKPVREKERDIESAMKKNSV